MAKTPDVKVVVKVVLPDDFDDKAEIGRLVVEAIKAYEEKSRRFGGGY